MKNGSKPRGWHMKHQEHLFFKASAGSPSLRIKFYHYPSYRQTVQLDRQPLNCKLKKKGNNSYFLFQQKIHSKGMLSFEREVTVFPIPSSVQLKDNWGRVSDIPRLLQRKYAQSSTYWPVGSSGIRDVSEERWFATDELSSWVRSVYQYITTKIRYPENQEKRLGADHALRTGIGDCDEFTDLFITLSRMRGIPCRRITGYHISLDNLDMEPHAWGEIFSPTLGWILIDIALHNIGQHTVSYVIVKIEEFNPSLLDYQVKSQSTAVHYHWECPLPQVTPIY